MVCSNDMLRVWNASARSLVKFRGEGEFRFGVRVSIRVRVGVGVSASGSQVQVWSRERTASG